MSKGKNFIISLQGEPLREGIPPDHAAALRPVFESIVDPKTIILFAACMDRWIEARRTGRNLTKYQAVRIHVNDMCELFGYKKHGKGGYQLAHKREVFRRLQELDILRGHGIVSNGKGGRMEFRGSFANVTFYRTVPLIGTPEPWEFIVRPGDAFAAMIEANPSEMRIYTKLAPFIASSRFAKGGRANEYAGKIGIYLCGIFRIRQKDVSFSDPITIGTILEGAGISTETIPQHYLRFRESIDDALDLLSGKVIAGWQYVVGDEERLPDRKWFPEWLKNRVIFEPLADMLEGGEQRQTEQQRLINSAKRRKRTKERRASGKAARS